MDSLVSPLSRVAHSVAPPDDDELSPNRWHAIPVAASLLTATAATTAAPRCVLEESTRTAAHRAVSRGVVAVGELQRKASDRWWGKLMQCYDSAAVEDACMIFSLKHPVTLTVANLVSGVSAALHVRADSGNWLGAFCVAWASSFFLLMGAHIFFVWRPQFLHRFLPLRRSSELSWRSPRIHEAIGGLFLFAWCGSPLVRLAAANHSCAATGVDCAPFLPGNSLLVLVSPCVLITMRFVVAAPMLILYAASHFLWRFLVPQGTAPEVGMEFVLIAGTALVSVVALWFIERQVRSQFETWVQLNRNTTMLTQSRAFITNTLKHLLPEAVLVNLAADRIVTETGNECVVATFQIRDFGRWTWSMLPDVLAKNLFLSFNVFEMGVAQFQLQLLIGSGDRYTACLGLRDNLALRNRSITVVRFGQWLIERIELLSRMLGAEIAACVGIGAGRCVAGFVGLRSLWYEAVGEAVNRALALASCAPKAGVVLACDVTRRAYAGRFVDEPVSVSHALLGASALQAYVVGKPSTSRVARVGDRPTRRGDATEEEGAASSSRRRLPPVPQQDLPSGAPPGCGSARVVDETAQSLSIEDPSPSNASCAADASGDEFAVCQSVVPATDAIKKYADEEQLLQSRQTFLYDRVVAATARETSCQREDTFFAETPKRSDNTPRVAAIQRGSSDLLPSAVGTAATVAVDVSSQPSTQLLDSRALAQLQADFAVPIPHWWNHRFPAASIEEKFENYKLHKCSQDEVIAVALLLVVAFLCCLVPVVEAQVQAAPELCFGAALLVLLARLCLSSLFRVAVFPKWEAVATYCLVGSLLIAGAASQQPIRGSLLNTHIDYLYFCQVPAVHFLLHRLNWYQNFVSIVAMTIGIFAAGLSKGILATDIAMTIVPTTIASAFVGYFREKDLRIFFQTQLVAAATERAAQTELLLRREVLAMMVPNFAVSALMTRLNDTPDAETEVYLASYENLCTLEVRFDTLRQKLPRLSTNPESALRYVERQFSLVEAAVARAVEKGRSLTQQLCGPQPSHQHPRQRSQQHTSASPKLTSLPSATLVNDSDAAGVTGTEQDDESPAAQKIRAHGDTILFGGPYGIRAHPNEVHATALLLLDAAVGILRSVASCTMVLALEQGYTVLLGSSPPSVDVVGPVARASQALLEASPPGPVLMTNAFSRLLVNHGTKLPRYSGDFAVIATQSWSTRGAGVQRVHLLQSDARNASLTTDDGSRSSELAYLVSLPSPTGAAAAERQPEGEGATQKNNGRLPTAMVTTHEGVIPQLLSDEVKMT